jgi:uracil-DNA glycosylase
MKKDLLDFFGNNGKEGNFRDVIDRELILANKDHEQSFDKICKSHAERTKENIDSILDIDEKDCHETCTICNLDKTLRNGWDDVLKAEFIQLYYKNIISFLHDNTFFPQTSDIFRFSFYFPIEETKVVILGQDPYHNENQAMGLSFSVPKNIRIPPSLKNIYKELKNDIKNFTLPRHGDLTNWASQGVLLLNDILTVEKNKPGSHSKIGWKKFTKRILEEVSKRCTNIVFLLWGNYARSKAEIIDKQKHLILEAAHPSPFSYLKFCDCKHFSKTNEYLIKHNKEPINWAL